MRNNNGSFLLVLALSVATAMLLMVGTSSAQTQKARATSGSTGTAQKPPAFSDYKGVRLGMTVPEVRAKLGEPAFSDSELDYYTISPTETAQIAYDSSRKVKVISIDYQNGTGAPSPHDVVSAELETRANGTMYRLVRYENLGFWVSYSRSASPANTVSITIQKM